MLFADLEGRITAAMSDLDVHPARIEEVTRRLRRLSDLLESSEFVESRSLPASAFGDSPAGRSLGTSHTRAQRVVEETLKGFALDLERCADASVAAVDLVTRADDGARADLAAQQQAVDGLTSVTRYSAAEAANRRARQTYLGETGTEAG